jgi:hypothetical protein
MMKKLVGVILLGILTCTTVQAEAFKSPDILIDSKLDHDWSAVLVSKFRLLLKNYKMNDPFVGRSTTPILLTESVVEELLPESSKDMIDDFGNAVGLSVLSARTEVHLHGFSYDVRGFKTDLKASEPVADGLVIGTDFSASEVNLSADKVVLSLVIPGSGASSSPFFRVEVIKPVIRAQEEKLINFFAKIKIQDNKDFYKLHIQKANFDQMADGLLSNPRSIDLSYERVVIPDMSLKIGSKTIHFSPEKIEKLIRNNHEAIKGILLAQAASTLRSNTAEAAIKVLEQYKMNKEHWLNSPVIKSQILLGRFSSSTSGDNIELNMPGDFCTNEKFDQLQKQCVHNKITQTAATRLNNKHHKESILVMKDLMRRGDANIVASISEDYLNKLLVTTYDAGLWKQALDEAGVELGPNKVIMKLDKRGDSGTLMMDVLYKPSKLEKFMTGSRQIRFPLILDVSVRIEKHDNEPVVIIRLNDVDTSDDTLINGKPQDNIVSTVKDVPRFKGKIAKSIRERLAVLKNKDILELRYPEFSGIGLDKVDFLSDGNGRMNAIMRLEDLIEDIEPDA